MDAPGTPPVGEDLAGLYGQLATARSQVERLDADLADARARAGEALAEAAALRAALHAADLRATAAADEAGGLRAQLDSASAELRSAAERYRDLVVTTAPELPAELIAGDSIAEVEASVVAARTVVGRVRAHMESQGRASHAPAGAPPRAAVDLGPLSPEQKIRHGLAARAQA